MRARDMILSLDIGAGSLKLGQFRALRGGGVELMRFAVRPLNADPAAEEHRLSEITLVLRELLAEMAIDRAPVLLSVPGQSVFSRFVKLPMANRDKIAQIVGYEAQQNVPFPINEVVWDYQLIGGGGDELDVMLAAIKAEIIEQITDAVSAAGLEPDLVDMAPMALYNAVRYNYPELPPCTLLIDIGARSTDLVFIEEGRVFNRSIPVGGNTITQQIMREFDLSYEDAEELKRAHAFVAFGGAYEGAGSEVADKVSKSVRSVMTRLHTEITRSINFYRTQQSGLQPTLALLTGGSSIIAHADTFLKEKLKIEVDALNPFANTTVNDAVDGDEIAGNAHLLGEVVGLALRRGLACPIELNLMPERFTRAKAFRKKQPFFVAAMALLVVTLAVWCVFFVQLSALGRERLSAVERHLNELRVVESRLRERETRLAALERNVSALAGLPERRAQWTVLLNAIRERLPEGLWITEFTPVGPEGEDRRRDDRDPYAEVMRAEDESDGLRTVVAIRISGQGYLDKAGTRGPIQLMEALRESEFFTSETDITEFPAAGPDDAAMEFTMRAVLQEPIQL